MVVPESVRSEYSSFLSRLKELEAKMNNIYDTAENIKRYQRDYANIRREIDENLNGKWVEYINIDPNGDPSFKKRKVAEGKWEAYREALVD